MSETKFNESNVCEDVLGRCRLFAKVQAERRRALAKMAFWQDFPKGRLIFQQGETCPGIYIVERGMVRVFKSGAGGKEHVLHLVGPNGTFAEVAAIGGFDCPAGAEATVDTRCLLLPLDGLRRAMAQDHQLCLEMMTGLCFWVHHLTSLMEDLVLRDAAGRLATFLLETDSADTGVIRLPALKRHIASHLNLTSEAFSRTFRRLSDAGLIRELEDQQVEIRDPAALAAVAEGI